MFGLGAKSNVPNTSQYDFKGTTVRTIVIFRWSHLQVLTNLPHQEQVIMELRQAMRDQNRTEVSASQTNYHKRPINSKAPNTDNN